MLPVRPATLAFESSKRNAKLNATSERLTLGRSRSGVFSRWPTTREHDRWLALTWYFRSTYGDFWTLAVIRHIGSYSRSRALAAKGTAICRGLLLWQLPKEDRQIL